MKTEIDLFLEIAADINRKCSIRLENLAKAIDTAADKGNLKSLDHAETIAENFLAEVVDPSIQVRLNYYLANIWSARRQELSQSTATVFDWRRRDTEREIFFLRIAVHHPGFINLDPIEQCSIETNLANILNHVGRFIDAIQYWERAIRRIPTFAMALGNRGIALTYYARLLYDPSHTGIMLLKAYDDLVSTLADDALFDNPSNISHKSDFAEICSQITKICDVKAARKAFSAMSAEGCNTKDERDYRNWCLKHRLFLNPLNDLGSLPVANNDILTTPDFVVKTGVPPSPIRFFNIMKQEYVSARYLCYEGLHNKDTHYADRDVLLYNTLDYSAHGLAIEQVKCAFRMAYSLFDKIAQFINHYWALGVKQNHVWLRYIWYRKEGKDMVLREQFCNYDNWPLHGLFWLSRDLFDTNPGFSEHTDPHARHINNVRQRLEHGFLSVHGMDWSGAFAGIEFFDDFVDKHDENLHAISREDLAAKTLRLLQLVRAALIYLVLAMHREERLRDEARGNDRFIFPFELEYWEDDWKR